ncbi:hypothetical protein COU60_04265 [Candidatus Pacearchaeota archaeon CG10_big_fil_rev_8_21_14_0_10_34_76]|nr:MAG: hypothetical protein COU60_04265 [Candidatus Pacearchaeota archaeon CG10_big_fil_rev_8_21_14_0_10_34_76]
MTYKQDTGYYDKTIDENPLLTKLEERDLTITRMEGDCEGSKAARDRLINSNLRLVKSIASDYTDRGISFEDLVEMGIIGLIKAIDGFKPGKGYKLSTYADDSIRRNIERELNYENPCLIRVPLETLKTCGKLDKKIRELYPGERVVDEQEILMVLKRHFPNKNANSTMRAYEIYKGRVTKLEFDIDGQERTDFENLDEGLVVKILEDAQRHGEIDEIELQIIEMRFGLNGQTDVGPMCYTDISRKTKIDRTRIRQIMDRALLKLRENDLFCQIDCGLREPL